jgi:uncharacterized membrane protein YkoI
MRYFVLAVFLAGAVLPIVSSPGFAQGASAPAVELHELLTLEKAQVIALEAVPGQVVQVSEKYAGQEMYYSFVIGVEDGSLYEVPVHSQTGEIAGIAVESIAERPKDIPFEIVSMEVARETVKAFVIENTPGKRPPFMRDGKLIVHERDLAYVFEPKRAGHLYTVLVDARSGEVIDIQGNAPK